MSHNPTFWLSSMKQAVRLTSLCLLCATFLAWPALVGAEPGASQLTEADQGFIVDAVVASVDGKPITLKDVSNRIGISETLSTKDLNSDSRARQVLESLIMEQLLLEEAAARNIVVSDSEVDRYIAQVAQKNEMSREEFESAIRLHQKDVDDYRRQVRTEITRSRLMNQLAQQGAAVTKEDIDQYLQEHPTLTKSGSKVKLRQIVVDRRGRDQEEGHARISEALSKVRDGTPFEVVAQEYSDAPEAAEGGYLGVMAEEDLSPEIFESLLSLDEGEVSDIISLPSSFRFFKVEERYLEKDEDAHEKMLVEVRKTLADAKLRERMQTFFTSDLTKLHFVDRKL